MSLDPKNIALQVALRTQQLAGSNQTDLNTAYQTGFTTLDGAEIPVTGLVDAVVATEGKLADLIGADRQNPYRATLYARSDSLAHNSEIPFVSEDGVRFVGVFSGAKDASTHKTLFESSAQEIERYWRRGNYTTFIGKYDPTASRFLHTRTRAYLEGCAWSRATAIARFNNTKLSPIPTAYEGVWIADTISLLVMEGWLITEASYYAGFADKGIAMIKNRNLDIPSLPPLTASANPVAN